MICVVCNFFHASWEFLAMKMNGVMVVVVEVKMILKISLSCYLVGFFKDGNGRIIRVGT